MSAEEYDNVPNLENVTTTTKTTKSKTKSKNDGESNLFRVLYGKLRDGVYNPVARLYASLVVNHPLTTLGCYLLLVLSITLGLFQASFVPVAEADATQRLTLLRNSEAENDRARLESTFPFDQSELYFQHKLTTFGYYFEIILNTRPPHGNLANRTILDQFNQLYDEIISLYITEPDEITSERNVTNMRNYTLRDLCTIRVNKCAAEGSVIRLESFQDKLLKGSVCYEQGDPKFMYLDYEAMDGASLKFLFSDDRNETCDNDNCCITEARFIRIRFDLKFETPTQASRSVKFMNAFVDHCETLEREKKYDFFELSYYTSHTMFPEIEKHSIGDVKFVIACFISFWLIYYLFLLFESSSVKRLLRRLCFCCSKKKSSVKESKKPFWVRSPGYLIFVTFLQYIFTGLGTLGFMALCRVKINTMLYSIGFITMIVSCHQSLLIYKNITGHGGHLKKGKRSSRHHRNDDDEDLAMVREQRKELLMKVVSQSSSAPVDETLAEAEIELNRELSREDSDIKRRFIQTSQQILVPAFFSLLSSVSAYCLIGIFSNLDAIRIYSYVLAVSLMFNFIGLVAFFCPSLVLHLRRVKSNRNCLLPLFKHQSTNTESNFSKQPSVKTPKSKTNGRSESKTTPTTYKRIVTDYLSQTVSLAKSGSMLVDNRKVRVVFLLIFLIYNVINVAVIVRLARVNIPVTDALPEKSYLRRHLDLHTRYFKLGPIVSINFMNSQKYWEKQTYTRIRSMLDDMESLRLMWPLELNWLREVRIAVSEMAEQEEINCNESDNASYECFIKQLDFFERPEYKGDYQLSMNADKTEMNITSSRMFLQMAKFEGVWDEWELMNTLKAIAENKYGFSKDELIIHSSVFPMLEQLGELIPATLSQFVLSLECVLAVAILLALVDLASVLVLALVHISFALSLLGNMFAFDLSLSIVTLLHLQMVPAIVIEFFAYMGYLYLFSAVRKRSSDSHHNNISVIEANARFHHNGETKLTNGNEIMETTSENTSSSSSSSTSSSASSYGGDERTKQYAKYPKSLQKDLKRRHRLECVHFAQQGATSTSALFALFVGLFSFSFLAFSSTYNFTSLFIVFASICFNLFLHLYVFYPVLLAFIGATWL